MLCLIPSEFHRQSAGRGRSYHKHQVDLCLKQAQYCQGLWFLCFFSNFSYLSGCKKPESPGFVVAKASPIALRTLWFLCFFSNYSYWSCVVVNFMMFPIVFRLEYGVQSMGGIFSFNQGTGFGWLPFLLSFIVLGAPAQVWVLDRQFPQLFLGLSLVCLLPCLHVVFWHHKNTTLDRVSIIPKQKQLACYA